MKAFQMNENERRKRTLKMPEWHACITAPTGLFHLIFSHWKCMAFLHVDVPKSRYITCSDLHFYTLDPFSCDIWVAVIVLFSFLFSLFFIALLPVMIIFFFIFFVNCLTNMHTQKTHHFMSQWINFGIENILV